MGSARGSLGREALGLTYMTYPRELPEEERPKQAAVERWLRIRNILPTSPDVQSKMYFLAWMLSGALSQMRGVLYRDYFLDAMDMMPDQSSSITVYPRVSFGPGQRYAAKGCYIVQLSEGPDSRLVKRSDWVAY